MKDVRIILFNGPPKSGKNYSADKLADELLLCGYKIYQLSLAEPLKDSVQALFYGQYNDYNKSDIIPEYGKTLRQLYIEMSEEFVKPRMGDNFWTRQIYKRMGNIIGFEEYDKLCLLVTDLGFTYELKTLVNLINFNKEYAKFYVVKTHRDGIDVDITPEVVFPNDSRSYVNTEGLCKEINIYNGDVIPILKELFDETE